MAKKAYDHLFKLLVIGDSGVGKTCLLVRFSDGTFMDTFINTIGVDFKIKTVQVDGKKIKLQIWDTAGHERFRTITTSYYRGSKGIILVYDITQEKTYDSISKWLGDIQEHADQGVQRCILANKCDLTDKRAVSKEKGEAFARENNIRFFEVSAKESINVEEAFLALASDILRKHTAVGEAEKGSIPVKSQPDRASGSGCC